MFFRMTTSPPARRVLLLVNPKSGSGNADLDAFRNVLRDRGFEVVERQLDDPERNAEHVRDARDFAALIVAGGDGTVSSIAYEVRDTGVPLLAFPAGTANLIAQNLSLPTDPQALANVLEAGNFVTTDLAELSAGEARWGFALIAGVGADALMIQDSEDYKAQLGPAAYLLGALKQIAPPQARFRLTLDDREIETQGISVLFANFGRANFRLPVARGIDPADGFLSVIVLRGRSSLSLLPNLIDSLRGRLNLGEPLFEGNLETYQCREARIDADVPLPLEYDGEVFGTALPASVRVLPGAARFLTECRPADLIT